MEATWFGEFQGFESSIPMAAYPVVDHVSLISGSYVYQTIPAENQAFSIPNLGSTTFQRYDQLHSFNSVPYYASQLGKDRKEKQVNNFMSNSSAYSTDKVETFTVSLPGGKPLYKIPFNIPNMYSTPLSTPMPMKKSRCRTVVYRSESSRSQRAARKASSPKIDKAKPDFETMQVSNLQSPEPVDRKDWSRWSPLYYDDYSSDELPEKNKKSKKSEDSKDLKREKRKKRLKKKKAKERAKTKRKSDSAPKEKAKSLSPDPVAVTDDLSDAHETSEEIYHANLDMPDIFSVFSSTGEANSGESSVSSQEDCDNQQEAKTFTKTEQPQDVEDYFLPFEFFISDSFQLPSLSPNDEKPSNSLSNNEVNDKLNEECSNGTVQTNIENLESISTDKNSSQTIAENENLQLNYTKNDDKNDIFEALISTTTQQIIPTISSNEEINDVKIDSNSLQKTDGIKPSKFIAKQFNRGFYDIEIRPLNENKIDHTKASRALSPAHANKVSTIHNASVLSPLRNSGNGPFHQLHDIIKIASDPNKSSFPNKSLNPLGENHQRVCSTSQNTPTEYKSELALNLSTKRCCSTLSPNARQADATSSFNNYEPAVTGRIVIIDQVGTKAVKRIAHCPKIKKLTCCSHTRTHGHIEPIQRQKSKSSPSSKLRKVFRKFARKVGRKIPSVREARHKLNCTGKPSSDAQ